MTDTCVWETRYGEPCDETEDLTRITGTIFWNATFQSDVATAIEVDFLVCGDHYDSFHDRVRPSSRWEETSAND